MAEARAKSSGIGSNQADRLACSECNLNKACVPAGLSHEDMRKFEQVVHKSRSIRAGEFVYRRGDPFSSVAAVRSGCFKSFIIDENAGEHVLGFHFPGDLLGLDAIHKKEHICDVVALETGAICNLRYKDVITLAASMPDLQSRLFSTMSQRIGDLNTTTGDYMVEQRMAAFLLTLSLRFKLRGYSERSFNLAMTRSDVGNYLRMAKETVSRVLSRFQDQGLITVDRRLVEILEHDGLHKVAGGAFCDPQNRV